MNLTQLRHLLAVADAGCNISLAANRLNTAQPAISRQLKQIEEELGFEIFVRRGRNLTGVTASGGALIARARAIVREIRNIEAISANHRADTRGTLRVATTQALGRFVLPVALTRLRNRFGNVQFRLRPGDEADSLAMLDRDEIDLALVSTEGDRPRGDVAIPLFSWHRIVIAPRDHPLMHGAAGRNQGGLGLGELLRHPLLAAESAVDPRGKIGRILHAAGEVPDIVCTARDADTIKTFVRQNFGLGIIAEMALTPDDSDLARLDTGDLFPGCVTWAVLRGDRIQRDYVFELLRALAPGLVNEDIEAALAGADDASLVARIGRWHPAMVQSATPSR